MTAKPKAKRQPYDARTLRYVARALTKERKALQKLGRNCHGIDGSMLLCRALQSGIAARTFAAEARDIARKATK